MTVQYLSDRDYQDYGGDLVTFSKRAALEAIGPQIDYLAEQNRELQHRLAIESRRNMDAAVERAIPNFRDLDRHPDWHRWLLGIDSLSGRVRQTLLDEAKASGDAARCIAFFRSFFARPGSAVGGGTSATYGRAGSAPSGQIYTRQQIQALYSAHRKGRYVGREAEWERQEQDIVRAAAEGRVLGPDYITK